MIHSISSQAANRPEETWKLCTALQTTRGSNVPRSCMFAVLAEKPDFFLHGVVVGWDWWEGVAESAMLLKGTIHCIYPKGHCTTQMKLQVEPRTRTDCQSYQAGCWISTVRMMQLCVIKISVINSDYGLGFADTYSIYIVGITTVTEVQYSVRGLASLYFPGDLE